MRDSINTSEIIGFGADMPKEEPKEDSIAKKKEKVKDLRVTRVEKRLVKERNPWYPILDELCEKTKNLYNYAQYFQRTKFGEEGVTYKEFDLTKLCSDAEEYKALPAQTSQQVIKMLCKNWKSFAMAVNQFKKHPEKFNAKPRIPNYLNKVTGRYVAVFTNQQAKLLANGEIKFPTKFTDMTIPTSVKDGLQQVRIIPGNRHYTMEIVYKIMPKPFKKDNGRYMGIDIGVNTLAAVVTNTSIRPLLIRGYRLKDKNKNYSICKEHYQKKAKEWGGSLNTKRLAAINRNRYNRVMTYFHKTSREIINLAIQEDINTIIIGDASQVGKFEDNWMIDIPMGRLIEMITYKAEEVGINVIVTDEQYTSHTSFMDDEPPTEEYYDKARRDVSTNEFFYYGPRMDKINADVNSAFQIIKKVIDDVVFSDEVKQLALDPISINDISVYMPQIGAKYSRWES